MVSLPGESVLKQTVQELGDVTEKIVEGVLRPPEGKAVLTPDKLDWGPWEKVKYTKADLIKELRLQRRHEKALMKMQTKANTRAAMVSSPLFMITASFWGLLTMYLALQRLSLQRDKEGNVTPTAMWAISVIETIPFVEAAGAQPKADGSYQTGFNQGASLMSGSPLAIAATQSGQHPILSSLISPVGAVLGQAGRIRELL